MSETIQCVLLNKAEDIKNARTIVRRMYKEQGYFTSDNEDLSGIETFLTLPTSVTFAAFIGKQMYGSVSLVMDNPKGFPMDSLYKEELQVLRNQGKRLAEVVQLAIDKDIYQSFASKEQAFFPAVPLFARIVLCAQEKKLDYLCISVNPKHVTFYTMIGFKKIGELKHYEAVDAPALALALSLKEIETKDFKESFFGKQVMGHINTLTHKTLSKVTV